MRDLGPGTVPLSNSCIRGAGIHVTTMLHFLSERPGNWLHRPKAMVPFPYMMVSDAPMQDEILFPRPKHHWQDSDKCIGQVCRLFFRILWDCVVREQV